MQRMVEALQAFYKAARKDMGRHRGSKTLSHLHSICSSMSTKDRLLYSALHGTAMRYAAEMRNLA
jgi:hypothetical protein